MNSVIRWGGGKIIILVVEVEQAQQELHSIRENGGGYHNCYQYDGHENLAAMTMTII